MRQIKTLVAVGALAAVGMTAERAGAVDIGGKLAAPEGVVEKVQKGGGSFSGGGGAGSPGAPSAGGGSPGGGSPSAASPGRGGWSYSSPGGGISGDTRGSGSYAGPGASPGPSPGIRSGSRAMRGNDAQPDRRGRGHRHHRRGRGSDFGVYIGPSYGYYGYYGYDGDGDCAWLHRRALSTGSAYWWRRYRQCIG